MERVGGLQVDKSHGPQSQQFRGSLDVVKESTGDKGHGRGLIGLL